MQHRKSQFIRRCHIVLCLSLLRLGPAAAQTLFTDVTDQVGLDIWSARNVAFCDYDNDGFQDVFLTENNPTGVRHVALFHNTGNGLFVDQTFLIPADLHARRGAAGAIFGDYDNDGDQDLFLPIFPHNALLRNEQGRFVQAEAGTDLADNLNIDNAIWLDYDRDGNLDLYASSFVFRNSTPSSNRLFGNNGDNTFTDQTAAAGLDIFFDPIGGGSRGGMAAGDFNDDGCPDLYLGVAQHANRLFFNDCQGSFEDVTTSEIGDEGDAFTITIGDIDNDLDLDIFQGAGGFDVESGFRSLLLMNIGDGQFLDVTESLGLAGLGIAVAGTALADIDNDGDLDLFVGYSVDESGAFSFLFLNDGKGQFTDETASSGIDAFGAYAAFGDYDEDGFVDLLFAEFAPISRTSFYRNTGNDNHWLRVEVVGQTSNSNGIGARLIASSGDLVQMREIFGGLGRHQNEPIAHFGLGSRTLVDRLEIRWPSGQVDVLTDIPADQKIRVIEGGDDYHVVHPTVWERPPPALAVGSTGELTAVVRPALFEEEAEITRVTADLGNVGGSMDVALTPGDDGTYRLKSTYDVSGPNRVESMSVTIEQATSLGPYWTNLSSSIDLWPAEDVAVFTDAEADNWTSVDWPPVINLTNHPAEDGSYPTWSPDGTRIAFRSDRDGNFEIYVMDADGSNPVNLTDHSASERSPAWSPDGTKILFTSNRDGNEEVYVMDADGSSPTNLTNNPALDAGRPAWSPDGTRIAFASTRDDDFEIYSMAADGTDQIRLTDEPAFDLLPSWSPNGTRIAFRSARDGNSEIYVMDADGSNPVNLTDHSASDSEPSWSPDGSRIAFRSNRDGNLEIHVMDADGSSPVRLTDHSAFDGQSSWSPDGTRIVFQSSRDGNREVSVMDLAAKVEMNPAQHSIVYQGQTAFELKTDGLWNVTCVTDAPLSTVGYETLHFAFHPGDTHVSDENSFRVEIGEFTLGGVTIDVLGEAVVSPGIDLEVRDWQVVELPLESSELLASIDRVIFSGNLTGTFYLDDIRLVTAFEPATVVEEDLSSALPEEFALHQNFPNPFNSGTVIRYALPQHGDVELTVYNLLGQRVMSLVQGSRQAGSYTLRWDGRDSGGRELASGVYLYRLQGGGGLVETRKMLLVR